MEIKYTVTAGEILQVLSFLLAVFATYNRISIKMSSLETKLDTLYEWWQHEVQSHREFERGKYRQE